MRTFALLVLLLASQALSANELPVPLLELTQTDGQWTWVNDNGPVADVATLLDKFAEHAGAGFKGRDKEGLTDNPLVIHVTALAPQADIDAVLELASQAGFRQAAVAAAEEVVTAAGDVPAMDKLDPAYVLINLAQEGMNAMAAVPVEQVTVTLSYDTNADAGSFVVAIDARGRKAVADSLTETHTLIYATGEPEAERLAKIERRATLQKTLCTAIEDYVAKGGANIERLAITCGRGYSPWVFREIACRACSQVNTNREKAGLAKLELRQSWIVPMPPEPEPEDMPEVEYPKDEPSDEYPTEDERVIEDATDEVNEDPSDRPNGDLAKNPNEDPSDNESPHPDKDSTTSAVGLGGGIGGGGGRGGKGGFAHRRARGGGGRPNEDRTWAALTWLKDHQHKDGYWSSANYSDDTTRAAAKKTYNIDFVKVGEINGDAGWESDCDVGLTGLSLLAFVGAGYDHKEGDYRSTCRQAILYLRKIQDNEGCFGANEADCSMYNQAICTMAMAEAYGLSGDAVLKPIVERAVDYIIKAQNPGLGWRYGVKPGVNDTSVTGWMVMALKSAKMAGLEIDTAKVYDDAAEWFECATVNWNGYPKCGYDSPGSDNARLRSAQDYETNPSMDAIYIGAMLSMGKADLNDATIKTMAQGCAENAYLPTWDHFKIDFYYWYYASLALYQVGGRHWVTWEKALSKTLLDNQRGWTATDKQGNDTSKETLDEHGSWDPVDAWGSAGGRVYSTALGALMLETTYRYQRIADKK